MSLRSVDTGAEHGDRSDTGVVRTPEWHRSDSTGVTPGCLVFDTYWSPKHTAILTQ